MFKNFIAGFFIVLLTVSSAYASEKTELSAQVKKQLMTRLSDSLGLEIITVKASPFPALIEVVTNQGMFYASADGKFLVNGKLYGLAGDNVVNHTEESLAQVRVDGMKQFEKDMIVYPASEEKYVITVFTDITCGYCRKLHKEMDKLNEHGITVRYLAYPRAGVKDQFGQYSKGFKDLRSIWCNEQPNEALTKAKLGSTVAQRICDKPIEAEFNFGRQIGVSGTPAIIFDNGFMLPGYKDPDAILAIIKNLEANS
ncbi:thiol:disulfide interchange protein DsbC [Thalassotalea insulae]|uniref:Thiol:disulfide interchange protein n=1 Tax=Thalassotalea insulae TaxID=2056778 RepID=A0ABQ6GW55_9GAMM|nr:bifunctional protein-disulfide isomerase/oxidoreductase DsbC [Thalassotalea insulae]GLX79597.1 thiol:disulfide interchange protein DsbC [Thalassotalea insulae]